MLIVKEPGKPVEVGQRSRRNEGSFRNSPVRFSS